MSATAGRPRGAAGPVRFPIRFDRAYGWLSTALFLRPAHSYVELSDEAVEVRMAWGFRTRFPRAAVRAAERWARRPLSRGVHGLAGRWLVNGSGDGIVRVALAPAQRAWVLGIPVRLETLLVSVRDPEALLRALDR